MIRKLLYLTYITLDETPTSGSSVRPLKMKEAFECLGLDLKVFGGINNNLVVRRQTVSEIKGLLKEWEPDACYIEPPSGPMFYHGDVRLIKTLHQIGVPTAIFYRDAYWKYPEYGNERPLLINEKMKQIIVKRMQLSQWKAFKKNIDLIYFPSMTMAQGFDCPHKDMLPPGGFEPDATEKSKISKPVQFIFVGGAARNYGTFLTLEAMEKLNKSGVRAKLTYVCPEQQWTRLGIDKDKYADWLELIHTSGEENLKPLYEKADVALLTAPRTAYRDFAVPVKLFEYMSYLKPMLVTDCIETAKVINDNKVGWVVEDNVDSLVKKLDEICNHPKAIERVRGNMAEARSNNLWRRRAEKVVCDLSQILEEKDKEKEG